MADLVKSSAARRRRERRLRSFLRHERKAVAIAVAEARHHSSKGQTTATAIGEVEAGDEQRASATEGPSTGDAASLVG